MPSKPRPPLLSLILLLPALACTGKDEGPPDIALSTDAVDFGEVGLGSTGSQDVEIQNMGGGTLEILSASLVDGDDDVFAVQGGEGLSIDGGQASTLTLTCEPEEEGAQDGEVQIRSNDEDEAQVYITLSCTGAPSTDDEDGDGYSPATGDCDDDDGSVYPDAPELCDGVDDDCSGEPDADESDADYDGYRVCEDDCDDTDANVYPDAVEICDDKDDDCDGSEADHDDQDGDGYSVCDGDCDDAQDATWPGNDEVCDDIDNDCSGEADDLDEDGDGHSPCGATGDCDDTDARAFPVVLDGEAADGGDGTDLYPYNSLDDALGGLDDVCRTVIFAPGTYTIGLSWTDGELTLAGGGDAPEDVILTSEEGERVAAASGGASLTLQNLSLQDSAADGDGGAVFASLSSLALIGVVATGNSSAGDGGAVAVNGGTLALSGCTFTGNTAADDGGAVAVVSGSLDDQDSVYDDNTGVRGGAVLLEGGSASIDGSSFSGNTASQEGGGVAVAGAGPVILRRSTFALNLAGTYGGGLSLVDVDDGGGEITNNLVQDNEASEAGGGVSITGDTAAFLLANNTLTGNVASGEGGGLYVDARDASGLYAWSNLVIASYGQSGLYVATGAGASVAWCTAYLSSSGVEFGGEVSAGSDENTEENPLFTTFSNDGDPTDDVLTLQRSSPARDSGPDESGWEDRDGSRNDRGATGGPEASP